MPWPAAGCRWCHKLARAEGVFAGAQLPMVVRITPFTRPAGLDAELAARGFGAIDDTRVMVAPRLVAPGSARPLPRGLRWAALGHAAMAAGRRRAARLAAGATRRACRAPGHCAGAVQGAGDQARAKTACSWPAARAPARAISSACTTYSSPSDARPGPGQRAVHEAADQRARSAARRALTCKSKATTTPRARCTPSSASPTATATTTEPVEAGDAPRHADRALVHRHGEPGQRRGDGLLAARDRSPYLRDWASALRSSSPAWPSSACAASCRRWPRSSSAMRWPRSAAPASSSACAASCSGRCRGCFSPRSSRVSLAAIGWFSVGVNDPAAQLGQRVMVFSALIALLSAPCVWLIVSHARREGTVLSVMALVAELLLVVLSLLRVAVNAVAPVQGGFESDHTREVLFVMAFGLAHLLQGYGLISLHVSQLLRRVAAQANTDTLTGLPNRRTFEDAGGAWCSAPSATSRRWR